jgi:large subunit ribosomal protein L24
MSRPKIKTNDTVLVLTGKDAGKKGKVTQVFPRQGLVVVEGVNQMTKNVRARRENEKGQRIEFNGPIKLSNVIFIDPKTGKPSRLGASMIDGKKVRRSVKTNEPVATA